MDWSRYSFLILMSLFGSVFIGGPHGFSYPTPVDFNGKLQRWDIQPEAPRVTYEVLTDDAVNLTAYKELVTEVSEIWNDVPSSYVEMTPVADGEVAMITINYDGAIAGGETSAGYAEFDASDEHGPKHCSIHIAAPSGIDWGGLAKTTLHEVGHCLGLGHSVVPESIMSYYLDRNNFGLALDDEAAVARLYPTDGSSPRKPVGCTIGAAPSGGVNFLLFLILLSPIPYVSRRIRIMLATNR